MCTNKKCSCAKPQGVHWVAGTYSGCTGCSSRYASSPPALEGSRPPRRPTSSSWSRCRCSAGTSGDTWRLSCWSVCDIQGRGHEFKMDKPESFTHSKKLVMLGRSWNYTWPTYYRETERFSIRYFALNKVQSIKLYKSGLEISPLEPTDRRASQSWGYLTNIVCSYPKFISNLIPVAVPMFYSDFLEHLNFVFLPTGFVNGGMQVVLPKAFYVFSFTDAFKLDRNKISESTLKPF